MPRFMLDTVSVDRSQEIVVSSANIRIVTTGKIMTMEELSSVQGRAWEDVDVSFLVGFNLCKPLTT